MQCRQRNGVQSSDSREEQCTRETGVPHPLILSRHQADGDEDVEEDSRARAILAGDWPCADDWNTWSGGRRGICGGGGGTVVVVLRCTYGLRWHGMVFGASVSRHVCPWSAERGREQQILQRNT